MSENTNGTTIGKFGYKQELKRTLSFKDLLVYGLIFMVGLAEIVLRTIFASNASFSISSFSFCAL